MTEYKDKGAKKAGHKRRDPIRRVFWSATAVFSVLSLTFVGWFELPHLPRVREIRATSLTEKPLADEIRTRGARFNEIIWWHPWIVPESALAGWAYKHYQQVQHIRFSNPDVSGVPFQKLREFERLSSLDVSGTTITEDDLSHLKGSSLTLLNLSRTKITVAGLRHFSDIQGLRYLILDGCSLSDDMLRTIGPLDLAMLSLRDTDVTDAGLKRVAQMVGIRKNVFNLYLANTRVTHEGLASLVPVLREDRIQSALEPGVLSPTYFPRLDHLDISGTGMTDSGLLHLRDLLSRARRLNLSRNQISDVALVVLEGMTNLNELDLTKTKVSDEGMRHLGRLDYLERLYVGGTGVTKEGARSLISNRQSRKKAFITSYEAKGELHLVVPPYDLRVLFDSGMQ